jgi:hypothetical protein
MNFEAALSAMRAGAKIWHPTFSNDEYLMSCRLGYIGDDITPLNEKPISIIKIKGNNQSDDMDGVLNYMFKIKKQLRKILTENDYKKYINAHAESEIEKIFDKNIFKFPQLNLFLVMSNKWTILGGNS